VTASDPAAARSWLFVPASRPDRFGKAAASGTDLVVVDLEDAVPGADKEVARRAAATWLSGEGVAAVRVNPVDSAHHDADVEALVGLAGLRAVLVPMADSVEALARVHERLGPGVALVPQVETALGVLRALELASAPGVVRLAFGHLDLEPGGGPVPVVLDRGRLTSVERSPGNRSRGCPHRRYVRLSGSPQVCVGVQWA
jgi:citrate lyase subunit beta/citryl-CoA lyase